MGMTMEKWFKKKIESLKDDPTYLKEYIEILEGELEAIEKEDRDLMSEVAHEAHAMGRAYNAGGEKATPSDVYNLTEAMINAKVKSRNTRK